MVYASSANHEVLINTIVDTALKHASFDGWTDQTLRKVFSELKLTESIRYQMFPRGGVDLALAFHERDDNRFVEKFASSKSKQKIKRVRDRIESAIICRLEIAEENKEAVKRSMSLLSTPLYMSDALRALWVTADKMWVSIGDETNDINWYSKRVILSSVYSAVMIFWIEDDSKDFSETRDFVTRRIQDVMSVERLKSKIKSVPFWKDFVKDFEVRANSILKNKEFFPGW